MCSLYFHVYTHIYAHNAPGFSSLQVWLWCFNHIDGLVQGCKISSALSIEILQSCTKSSTVQHKRSTNPWFQRTTCLQDIRCVFLVSGRAWCKPEQEMLTRQYSHTRHSCLLQVISIAEALISVQPVTSGPLNKGPIQSQWLTDILLE